MKAIMVHETGGPEVMRLEDVNDPVPGPGEVLINVKAAGVNPVDVYFRAGTFYKAALPFTPGFDVSGEIGSVGEGVSRFKPGDRVYASGTITGGYAQKALCKESKVFPLAQNLTLSQGACVGVPFATAYRALFHRGRAVPGETALIHGATGGVGTASVQLARAAGLKVIATGGTEKGRGLALSEGAHHVLDHHDPGHLDKALSLTGGKGVNLIIEFLADANLGSDLKALAKHGRVVVVGCRGTVEIDPRDAISRDADIRGMSLFNATEEDLSSIHAALFAGFENKTLCPVVGKELRLEEAPTAHKLIMEGGAYGKIILIP